MVFRQTGGRPFMFSPDHLYTGRSDTGGTVMSTKSGFDSIDGLK